MLWKPFISLLHSRKFLLAVFAVVQSVIFAYIEIDPSVWQAIDGLILALIAAIAWEDAAEKRAGNGKK